MAHTQLPAFPYVGWILNIPNALKWELQHKDGENFHRTASCLCAQAAAVMSACRRIILMNVEVPFREHFGCWLCGMAVACEDLSASLTCQPTTRFMPELTRLIHQQEKALLFCITKTQDMLLSLASVALQALDGAEQQALVDAINRSPALADAAAVCLTCFYLQHQVRMGGAFTADPETVTNSSSRMRAGGNAQQDNQSSSHGSVRGPSAGFNGSSSCRERSNGSSRGATSSSRKASSSTTGSHSRSSRAHRVAPPPSFQPPILSERGMLNLADHYATMFNEDESGHVGVYKAVQMLTLLRWDGTSCQAGMGGWSGSALVQHLWHILRKEKEKQQEEQERKLDGRSREGLGVVDTYVQLLTMAGLELLRGVSVEEEGIRGGPGSTPALSGWKGATGIS